MNGDEPIQQNRQELIALLDTILAKAADQAHEIDKALLTLSSGSLVISMTLVGRSPGANLCLGLLFGSWACFAVCLILVVVAMTLAHLATHKSAKETADNLERFSQMSPEEAALQRVTRPVGTDKTVGTLNILAVGVFIIGVALLGWFAAANVLSQEHARCIDRLAAGHQTCKANSVFLSTQTNLTS